ncbi:asparagine--tRNA ligase [Desulfovibrionales bacterium]
MSIFSIKQVLTTTVYLPDCLVRGWVRTKREVKGFSFLEINDGSCLANLQVLVQTNLPNYQAIPKISTGAAVEVAGELVASPGKGQCWELKANSLHVLGYADPVAYPIQKKHHTDEFLRSIAHFRARTNKFGAMLRIRSEAALAIHDFFREHEFYFIHTPIITGSNCEGAGETFRVTTLPNEMTAISTKQANKKNLCNRDFFNHEAHLTVSGQLEAECLALALSRVYAFGPIFRAENSNTSRHAAEFWMVEPEMAFCDLKDAMELAEACVKQVVSRLLEACSEDLALFNKWVDPELISRLEGILTGDFARLPYAKAVTVLEHAGNTFEFPVGFGLDLKTEHERYLAEIYCQRPVFVYNYPATIKPFYMRVNEDANSNPTRLSLQATVAAMDLLVPRIGELIGGSQREERLDVLKARLSDKGLQAEKYWWYLDLRRFGSAPHAGFGLGFERLLMFVTGIPNIRDVIPFPRTPRHLEF